MRERGREREGERERGREGEREYVVVFCRKKKLLSPSDIRFPWRPMYDLIVRISDTKFKRLGMKIYSE